MAHGSAQRTVFTVEASLQEVMYVVGPTMAAMVVAFASPRSAVWLCGALAVLGALGFLRALRRAGMDQPVERSAPHSGRSLLADRSLLLALLVATSMVASFVMIDIVIVAWARDLGRPAMAGVLTAVWGIGSVLGGLIAGGLSGEPRFARRMVYLALGAAALIPVLPPVLVPSSPWLIGGVLLVGGMAIAPAIAANNTRIGAIAPEGRRAEAFGWMTTATTAGSAMALPIAGALLDHIGPAAAAAASALAAVIGAVLAGRVRSPTATSELAASEAP
jgi:predicted MFS family arabinose efflux permease